MECIGRLKALLLSPPRLLVALRVRHSGSPQKTQEGKRTTLHTFKTRVASGPTFQDFVKGGDVVNKTPSEAEDYTEEPHPYLPQDQDLGHGRKGLALSVCVSLSAVALLF